MGVRKYWTKQEDAILRKHAGKKPIEEILKLLPGRTLRAVTGRCSDLRLSANVFRRQWSKDEDDLLRQSAGRLAIDELTALFPTRSRDAILTRCACLQLSTNVYRLPWTKDDDDLLRKSADRPIDEVALLLSRTRAAVCKRAVIIGARVVMWSDQETDYLRANADVPAEDTAAVLGRTVDAVCGRASNCGISLSGKSKDRRPWVIKDDIFLRKNAGLLSVEELANKLGRSSRSIQNRGHKLRVTRALRTPCRVCGRKFKTASIIKGNSRVCCDSCAPMYLVVRSTVTHHHHWIFKSKSKRAMTNYKKMPFFDEWNPDKGGSFLAAVKWIIENLGPRPEGSTLHVIPQTMKGFWPGNLVWAGKREQSIQQHYKIIGRQNHQIKQLEADKFALSSKIRELEAKLSSKVEHEELYLKRAA
jgi:hypothetical protein